MEPIIKNAHHQAFDADDLNAYIITRCQELKKNSEALAFAFIIYDFKDYTIQKIIKDSDYWTALDRISGDKLCIFYIDSRDCYYARRQEEIYRKEVQQEKLRMQDGLMSFLVPVTREPTPLDNAVKELKQDFNIKEDIKTPFILFFQTDGDAISDSYIISLEKEKVEDAFIELRAWVKCAVNSISKVHPENYGNHQEIFNLIKSNLKSWHFYSVKLPKLARIAPIIGKLIKSIHPAL
jgi:hypothetical protein